MLEPFEGAEGPENNPYQHFRVGRIEQVFDDLTPDNRGSYMTVSILWIDRGGSIGSGKSHTARIRLTQPHISRGWGYQFVPSKGDTVVCGFRMEGYPVVVGFWPNNLAEKILNKNDFGYYFRNIVEGEYCLKSKQGAEWYLDRKGSLRLIVRDQSQTINFSDVKVKKPELFNNPLIDPNEKVVKDIPYVEVIVGQVYDSDFQNEIKSSAGKSILFRVVDHKNGNCITLDADGNMDVVAKGNVTVSGLKAEICGSQSLALKSELDALAQVLTNFIDVFNAHVGAHTATVSAFAGLVPVAQGTQKLKGS